MDETRVPLKEYIEKVIDEKEKQVILRYNNAKEALELSKKELDRRLEGLNELRSEVLKDRSQFVKVDTYESEKKAVNKELKWMQRVLFIGMGGLAVLVFILNFIKR